MIDLKQAIVVRENLNLSVGKIAAQVAHASLSSALIAKKKKRQWFKKWEKQGQKKVVLKADLKTIEKILKKSTKQKVPCKIVKDAGLTEVLPGTITALGIGPAPNKKIDKLIGSLPLL